MEAQPSVASASSVSDQPGAGSESSFVESLLAISPGPARIVESSSSQGWQGILVEKHLCSTGERVSSSTDCHVVSIFHGSPASLEHRSLCGHFVRSVIGPRTAMITPVGPVPHIRLHTSVEITHCALEERFVRNVINELDHAASKPMFHIGICDNSIHRILGMLAEELGAERPSGRLYVDSLALALATRYVLLDVGIGGRTGSPAPGLLPRVLSRVRARIEANLATDLSLQSLAEESGYSRAHFLRMFRAATGLTPHQYVLDLRLRRAKEQLRQAGSSIVDVAVSCGFSSQSHMTSVFRRRLAMTPGEFRRNA